MIRFTLIFLGKLKNRPGFVVDVCGFFQARPMSTVCNGSFP